jgi:hypothetical protein
MFKSALSFSLFMLLFAGFVNAQENHSNSIEFSPQVSAGVFTANHKLTGTAYGGELLYHINTVGNPSQWMRTMRLKSIDLVFNYKNMGDVKLADDPKEGVFGDSYALLGGLNISLIKLNKTELLFSPAFGIGYAAKTFFTNGNPLIGSHTNFTSRAGLKIATALSPATQITAGIDILHYSNAAVRVPNNGMNTANISLGIVQAIGKSIHPDSSRVSSFRHKTHSFDIGINMGRRGVYQSKEGYFRTGLYAGYNYRLNSIFALSSGIDAVYYHSVFDPADFNRTYQSFATSYEHWRVGAALGPDIWMGRLALMMKYGYYLHYNSYRDNHTYWTAGMKYNALNWAAVQAKIYIHKTEADFVGFGFIFTPGPSGL